MFFTNNEILGFYSIFELVLCEIVKHDGYLIVRLLTEMDNGFNMNNEIIHKGSKWKFINVRNGKWFFFFFLNKWKVRKDEDGFGEI